MTTAELQGFLRSLGGALAAIGVAPKSLEDLRSAAQTLDPFADLSLEQLANFLRLAAEYRETGRVQVDTAPEVQEAAQAARRVERAVRALVSTDSVAADELEAEVVRAQDECQAAFDKVKKRLGIGLSAREAKKWRADRKAEGATSRAAGVFRRLVPLIASPESYQCQEVGSAITELAATDGKVLRAAALVLRTNSTGSGRKLVESMLESLTGIKVPVPAAEKKIRTQTGKASEPSASAEDVETMTNALKDMLKKTEVPDAVSDPEIETILTRVRTEFSTDQMKEIAKKVTGKGGRGADSAIGNLRTALTAVKQAIESQKV